MKKYIKSNFTLIVIFMFFLSSNKLISQWQPDTRLTNDTAESVGTPGNSKWIAASGNKLHVVWPDNRNGHHDIFYKRSSNNGESWSSEVKINDTDIETYSPSIAVSGFKVHIVWNDQRNGNGEIYYCRSTNEGVSWGNNIRLTNDSFPSGSPSITCSGENINICWTDLRDGNAEIYFKKSTDNGTTWSTDTRLTTAASVSEMPALGQDGLNLHVVWDDWRNGQNKEIYYKRSTDGGASWSSDFLLSNTPITVWGQTISVSGSNIHVSYMVQTIPNGFEIFYKHSTDGGNTWSAEISITNSNTVGASTPAIFANGTVVHLVCTENIIGFRQLVYYRSTNNGNNWTIKDTLTNSAIIPDNPCIVSSNSEAHVVWNDSRDGNKEIYYKKNSTCNAPFTVSGLVSFKDNNQPVTGGFVKALKYNSQTSEIITIDSTVINSNGTYMLSHVPSDVLDLMYYQNDDLLQFVPTYYVSTIDWREATKINPTQNLTNINCQVYRINNTVNPFTISGQIIANLDNSTVTSMKDAIVYAKIGNEFRNYGISGTSGSYITTKLPSGSYELITYRMGFAPVSQNVTITNSSLSNINVDLGSPLIGINTINENIPSNYLLSQNFPNPFNPYTTIKFDVPVAGLIKLSVYDILGREIEVLANENLTAGSYSVNWNASNYPSGIYFYRMETREFSETKKMILIK